jgi:DNA repair and recombination protein RAD54B
MLYEIYNFNPSEKVVVVSNWTSTLNVIQELCKSRKYQFLRLDGSTPQKQRQEYVDTFNREGRDRSFVFLLSAKAGGVGLNLIG